MRGRKPKPTALRVIDGNRGRRPLNEAEPKPARGGGPPPPPLELDAVARAEWERTAALLHESGVLTLADLATLAAYCVAFGTFVDAEAAIARLREIDGATRGLLAKTKQGNYIQNPLIGARNKAAADMVRYAAELGMTPSARSRVAVGGRGEEDPAEKYLA